MSKAEKVAAEVIEDQVSPIAKSELWLGRARARVSELAAQYKVPDEIADNEQYKAAKASRASVRKDAAALDAERKAMTREMDEALARFRDGVKGVLAPLTELDVAYKAALDAYDERWGAERRAVLQAAYDEYAPDLVPLVPLDRLIALRGSEKGRQWLGRTTNVEAAKASLRAAVDAIASDEEALARSVDPEDMEGAKADLFATLDLGAAIRNAQARAEQRERVRRLEEERRAREAEYERIRAEREAAEAEAARQRAEAERAAAEARAAQAAPRQREAPAVGGVMSREEAAEAWRATTPNIPVPRPLAEHVAESMGQPEPGRVPAYLMCCYGSVDDAEAFKAWCEQRHVKATVRPTGGSTYRIVRR